MHGVVHDRASGVIIRADCPNCCQVTQSNAQVPSCVPRGWHSEPTPRCWTRSTPLTRQSLRDNSLSPEEGRHIMPIAPYQINGKGDAWFGQCADNQGGGGSLGEPFPSRIIP